MGSAEPWNQASSDQSSNPLNGTFSYREMSQNLPMNHEETNQGHSEESRRPAPFPAMEAYVQEHNQGLQESAREKNKMVKRLEGLVRGKDAQTNSLEQRTHVLEFENNKFKRRLKELKALFDDHAVKVEETREDVSLKMEKVTAFRVVQLLDGDDGDMEVDETSTGQRLTRGSMKGMPGVPGAGSKKAQKQPRQRKAETWRTLRKVKKGSRKSTKAAMRQEPFELGGESWSAEGAISEMSLPFRARE